MINKKKLETHFSNHAKTYDQFAIVQKEIAKKTYEMISNENVDDVFEFGAGTGELTELLINQIKTSYTCLDLSESMHMQLEQKIQSEILNTIQFDIEHYRYINKYDLIVSSSTLQWVKLKEDVILRSVNALKEKGELVISYFHIYYQKYFIKYN